MRPVLKDIKSRKYFPGFMEYIIGLAESKTGQKVDIQLGDVLICARSYRNNFMDIFERSNSILASLDLEGYLNAKFVLDIYSHGFSIRPYNSHYNDDPKNFFVHVENVDQFTDLSDESYFQMQVAYDLQDLTRDELGAILYVCSKLKENEVSGRV
ncbi:hypothetical protein ABV23_RS00995 [Escherichia coli]|nr:hypothetical protein [Escherichia coli]